MFTIAIRTLRSRRMGFVGAFVATSLAVALVACWGILMESALRSTPPVHRLAAAPIVVTGHQNLTVHSGHGDNRDSTTVLVPERARVKTGLVDRLRAVPGVEDVVPDVSFPATANGAPVNAHGWSSARLTPVRLRAGHAPTGPTDLAAPAPHKLGDHVRLTGTTGTADYTVAGIVPPGDGVFVSDPRAAGLAGHPGAVDLIGVFPAGSAAAVQKAVGPAGTVLTGADRGDAESLTERQQISDLVAISGSIGGIVIAVAVFVVAATLSISVQQRYREIALLRAVAATPWQVRRMVACEGLVLAVVAGCVGALPGILLAHGIRGAFVHKGLLSSSFRLHVGWIPFLVAGGAGLVVVQGGSFVAGRRASKVRPTAALQESVSEPPRLGIPRLLLGLAALAGGCVLLSLSMSMQGDSAAGTAAGVAMVFLCAIGLLGPLIAKLGVALLGLPVQWLSRVGGFLAAVNSRARSRRLASAVTPVALCIAMAFITVFLQSTIAHGTHQQSERRVVADRVVRAPGPGISAGAVARIGRLSGVDSAVGLMSTQALIGGDMDPYPAQAVSPGRLDRVLDLDVRSGALPRLKPGEAALSLNAAKMLHAHVGQRASFRLGDGAPTRLRVVATYDRSLGFADVLVPWQAAVAHVTTPAASLVFVRGARVSDRTITAAVPGGQIVDRSGYAAQEDRDQKVNAWVNYLLLGVIVVYAAIAMVNTLVMTVAERRREFALTRLVGATSRQVLRMVRWEAALVVVLGIVVGSGAGLAALVPFSRGITGSVSGMHIPPLPAVAIAASAALLAFTATVVPARLAMRQRPIDAVGIRE